MHLAFPEELDAAAGMDPRVKHEDDSRVVAALVRRGEEFLCAAVAPLHCRQVALEGAERRF